MDPKDLAVLNQWLAGRNSQAAPQPLVEGEQAEAIQGALGLPQLGLDWPDSWNHQDARTIGQQHADALEALAGRSAGPMRLTSSAPAGEDGAAPASQHLLSSSMDPSGLPLHNPTFPAPSPPPSTEVQDAAGRELLIRGVNPDADYYPSENDALANLARGRAAPSWDPAPVLNVPAAPKDNGAPPLPNVIGSHGYMPASGDENLLARAIYAEGANTPDDYDALGWSMVNRVGASRRWKSLNDVIHDPGQFSSVKGGGSPRWRETADPSRLNAVSAKAWAQAQEAAHGVLSGSVPDPTGGGQFFFSSDHYNGHPETAPRNFRDMLSTLRASPYQGHTAASGERNYFFVKDE